MVIGKRCQKPPLSLPDSDDKFVVTVFVFEKQFLHLHSEVFTFNKFANKHTQCLSHDKLFLWDLVYVLRRHQTMCSQLTLSRKIDVKSQINNKKKPGFDYATYTALIGKMYSNATIYESIQSRERAHTHFNVTTLSSISSRAFA